MYLCLSILFLCGTTFYAKGSEHCSKQNIFEDYTTETEEFEESSENCIDTIQKSGDHLNQNWVKVAVADKQGNKKGIIRIMVDPEKTSFGNAAQVIHDLYKKDVRLRYENIYFNETSCVLFKRLYKKPYNSHTVSLHATIYPKIKN